MKIEVREIIFGSIEHEFEVKLRQKILRDPLGLKLSQEELKNEFNHYHIGAFKNEVLVGCLVLSPLDKKIIKMRQVAVDSSVQGLGVGTSLVSFSENVSRSKGFLQIQLNARLTAVSFYLKLGYETDGEVFNEVAIPHRKMKKIIAV